jgi:hypothetical protein
MSNSAFKRNLFRSTLLFVTFACVSWLSHAQTVVYDWSSNSKVPESYPKITRPQKVTFRITNVNDILYTYRLEVTQTPIVGDDFGHISALFKLFTPSGGNKNALSKCEGLEEEVKDAIQKAIDEINKDPKLPVGYAASATHTSIPLEDSKRAWGTHETAINSAKAEITNFLNQCQPNTTVKEAIRQFLVNVNDIDAKVKGPHVFVDTHDLAPGNDVSVMVVEMFGPETVSTKTFTFPGTDILTLSAGALFSRIQDRGYESRKSPNSTLNLLTVEGNSRATPAIVALLNYSLGALHLDGETAGLALSAGPVIKLGAKSDASSFGFFTGMSGHLYHRFFITPGIHFGQFADFPVGFGNGSTIPANFGELTPVKRWTARFGLAITFKTKDFSGLASSDTPSVKTDEGGGSKPKQPKPPDEDGSAMNASNPLMNSIAQGFLKPNSETRLTEIRRDVMDTQPTDQQRELTERAVVRDAENTVARRSTNGSTFVSLSESRGLTRITSLNTSSSQSGDERVILNSAGSIQDYSMYFKGGRFYLVIPHARLDVIEDGLDGRVFGETLIQTRRDDLVISFVLLPGTKASVIERPNGLDLLFVPSNTN